MKRGVKICDRRFAEWESSTRQERADHPAQWKYEDSWEDYGWYVTAIKVGVPAKRKVLETVPYRSGSYDFSDLYGTAVYEDREIVVTFRREITGQEYQNESAAETDRDRMLARWLYGLTTGRRPMKLEPGQWVYAAECVSIAPVERTETGFRTMEATFAADPFRRYEYRLSEIRNTSELDTPLVTNFDATMEVEDGGWYYIELENAGETAVEVTLTAEENTSSESLDPITPAGYAFYLCIVEPEWEGSAILPFEPVVKDATAGTYKFTLPPGDWYAAVNATGSMAMNFDWRPMAI